jgi:hypothetical protein
MITELASRFPRASQPAAAGLAFKYGSRLSGHGRTWATETVTRASQSLPKLRNF